MFYIVENLRNFIWKSLLFKVLVMEVINGRRVRSSCRCYKDYFYLDDIYENYV